MSEPLSIAAGVVGIVVPALHGTRLLLEDLQQLKDAPKTVKRLTDDVHTVHAALELLEGVRDGDWNSLGKSVAEQSEVTISSCTEACNLFRADLLKWTRHSEDGKLAWVDRANVGFFKKDQVKAMSEQLQSCKLAINLIVGVATLYSSVRNSHITNEIKKTISAKQAEVKDAIITADKQLILLENRMEDMNLSNDDEEAVTPAEGKTEALRQLEEERKALDASRKLLDELLSKAREDSVAKAAVGNQSGSTTVTVGSVTFGKDNKGYQAAHVAGGDFRGMRFGGQ